LFIIKKETATKILNRVGVFGVPALYQEKAERKKPFFWQQNTTAAVMPMGIWYFDRSFEQNKGT
jgi:hypothetical protein